MKFTKLLYLAPFLFSINVLSELSSSKSEVVTKSNECFKDLRSQICKNLILKTEKIQLIEFEKNRYKCQSSILGLQTELIKAYYFEKGKKMSSRIMIPYVIKNC